MKDERRQELLARFPVMNNERPMNPALNTTVQSMLRTERIAAATGWGHGAAFDPERNRKLYAKARAAHANLRAMMAAGDVTYATHNGLAPYDPDDPNDTATLVNFVGDAQVYVCRSPAERFAILLRRASTELAPTRRCAVAISADCNDARDMSWLLPVDMGTFLLVFECCAACREEAGATADTNMQFSQIAAHDRVNDAPTPAWARVAPWWLRRWAALRRWLRAHTSARR